MTTDLSMNYYVNSFELVEKLDGEEEDIVSSIAWEWAAYTLYIIYTTLYLQLYI